VAIGTKRRTHGGYILVKVAYGNKNWRPEHVLIMEEAIGRRLRRAEQVHHINGIKDDNGIENLHLFPDTKTHIAAERSCADVVREFLHSGQVSFNRESGIYQRLL